MTEEASFVYSKCIWLFWSLGAITREFRAIIVSLVDLFVSLRDLLVSFT